MIESAWQTGSRHHSASSGSSARAAPVKDADPDRICIDCPELNRSLETGRVIGEWGDGRGPTVVVTAGLHGNEPTGVFAAADVLEQLEQNGYRLKGRFVALAGNMAALAVGRRQIDRDLNRVWTGAEIERLLKENLTAAGQRASELREAHELHTAIREILDRDSGPFFFVDLHTTSSQSCPFVPFDDTLKNRDFAQHFPVAGVLGIEEYLPGTLLSYLTRFNVVTLGYEGGQHIDPASVDSHSAMLWLALLHAGCLTADCGVDFEAQRCFLAQRAGELKGFFDVRFRYGIEAGESFRMKPGFRNFAPVKKGQHLADNDKGPVRAGFSGNVLMPLYQSTGSDGFFLVRSVAPFWLKLSRWMRRGHWEKWLAVLPGVRIAPGDPDTLLVDTRIARFLASEIFHLLGYRRSRIEGTTITFSRREIVDRPSR